MAFTLDKVGKVLPLFFSGLEPAKKERVGKSVIDPKMEDPPLWQCKKTSKNMLFLILICSITLSLWRVMFFVAKQWCFQPFDRDPFKKQTHYKRGHFFLRHPQMPLAG